MQKYIEKPFRIKGSNLHKIDKKQTAIFFLASGLLMVIISTNVWAKDGWPFRSKYQDLKRYFFISQFKTDTLLEKNSKQNFEPDKTIRIAVLGDSHSRDLTSSLLQHKTEDMDIQRVSIHASCYAEKDTTTLINQFLGMQSHFCATNLDKTTQNPIVKEATHIIIVQRWRQRDLESFEKNISRIKQMFGNRLFLVGQNATFPNLLPAIFSEGLVPSLNSLAFNIKNQKDILINEKMREIAVSNEIPFLDRQALVCDFQNQSCLLVDEENNSIYSDDNHWSFYGEHLFGKAILDQILSTHR